MIVPLNKALSLKGLEIKHTLQSEENFVECYRSTKKRVEFMESYSGLHVRYYCAHASVQYHNKVAAI